MINSPYYQQIKPWPHLKGGVNNMGRLEEPQILLDMLRLPLDVSFGAGAGCIPRQLCSTHRDGTGGDGVAGASREDRRSILFGWLLESQGKAAGSAASQVRAELLPGEGLSGLQQGRGQTQGEANQE